MSRETTGPGNNYKRIFMQTWNYVRWNQIFTAILVFLMPGELTGPQVTTKVSLLENRKQAFLRDNNIMIHGIRELSFKQISVLKNQLRKLT